MYSSKYDTEHRHEANYAKKWIVWIVGLCTVISIISYLLIGSGRVLERGISDYEEFQEIYNTCLKLDTDIATYHSIPADDKTFNMFSKEGVIAQKKQNLARWVEDYNARSRVWTRSMWKSSSLPYELKVEDFPNYYK